MDEKSKLCEKYRKFASETLQSDYEELVKAINCITDEAKEYETLLLFINKIKVNLKRKKINGTGSFFMNFRMKKLFKDFSFNISNYHILFVAFFNALAGF